MVSRDGKRTLLPLAQAKSFELYERREITLAAGDAVRIAKNFRCGVERFTNNELCRVAAIGQAGIHLDDAGLIRVAEEVHLDQGIAVTSHASQGKTVDQVIVSVPVSAFSQANEAQFYVSMSRARTSMHVCTDSKVALKEAVTPPGERLSPCEMISKNDDGLVSTCVNKSNIFSFAAGELLPWSIRRVPLSDSNWQQKLRWPRQACGRY
jgi:hypothetical protein